MSLERLISDGLEGKNIGLGNGLGSINEYIFGLQRGFYILLGGMSGTYKSLICDFIVQNAIVDAEKRDINLHVFYYSYEIPEDRKLALWLSNSIYRHESIQISLKKMLNLNGEKMNSSEQDLCK